MIKKEVKKIVGGIVPPMITPLKQQDSLDVQGLEKLIEYILKGGVSGLFILGTTSEGVSLSYKIRYELVERVCRQVNSRVPVFVGITDTSFTESVKLAQHAADNGADFLVAAPPFYFTASQSDMVNYFEHLASKVELPVFLYNMPGCTKIALEPQTVLELSAVDGIAGIKDSSADMMYLHKVKRLLQNRPDFPIFIGPEELLTEFLLLGGSGGISAGANIYPQLYVNIYNAAKNGDIKLCNALQKTVIKISSTVYSMSTGGSSPLKGLKCALELMGICSDFVAEPFEKLGSTEAQTIKKVLNELELL